MESQLFLCYIGLYTSHLSDKLISYLLNVDYVLLQNEAAIIEPNLFTYIINCFSTIHASTYE